MKTITSHAFSQSSSLQRRTYNIVNGLKVEVQVTSNPYQLELEQLFQMAARINKKRSFLFVSKLLGKHIPVNAALSLSAGAILGRLYEELLLGRPSSIPVAELINAFEDTQQAGLLYKRLMDTRIKVEQPTLFIGFAETATALGHSMFDTFEGNISFMHTTRELIEGLESVINFEEEHSHAMSHRCYAEDPALFSQASRVVLVDDEMTTGNTSLNIIKELHARFGHREFVIAALLDWRSKSDQRNFKALESELGIVIDCISILKGEIKVQGSPAIQPEVEISRSESATGFHSHSLSRFFEHYKPVVDPSILETSAPYVKHTGRFGLNEQQNRALLKEVTNAAEFLVKYRMGNRTLCIGSGEFMYIPMRIASLMGEGVFYQSTTRSPIYPTNHSQYAVTSAYRFDSLEDPSIPNYMYNIMPGQYDEIFVFLERELEPQKRQSFEQALRQLGIPIVHFVYCS